MHSIFPSIRVSSNEFFASGIQSIGASASVLPINIQDWFPLGLTEYDKDMTSLNSNRLSRVFFNITVQIINSLVLSSFYSLTLTSIYEYWKNIALTRWTFVGKEALLIFNMLSMLAIAFLPSSKCLLISWLQSPSAVILKSPKNKVWHCFHCFPIYLPWSDGTRCHDLSFLNVEF